MKSIRQKQYAEALFALAYKKKGTELEEIVTAFLAMVLRDGRVHELKSIVQQLEKLIKKDEDESTLHISSAHKISARLEKKVAEMFVAKRVTTEVDDRLIGGIRIRFKDLIIDNSVTNALKQLKNKLSHEHT